MALRYPHHIAFIPDGNRRWAKAHALSLREAYNVGINKIYEIGQWCKDIPDIKYVTFWGFSTENYERNKKEIDELWKLFDFKLSELLKRTLKGKGVRIRFYGDLTRFPPSIQEKLTQVETITADEQERQLSILLMYGGRHEILTAVRSLAEEVHRGVLNPKDITEEVFVRKLFTGELPDPDLIIRTANERRMSGFMPWHAAYSELYFIPKPWPDITKEDLFAAFEDYAQRVRKFGR